MGNFPRSLCGRVASRAGKAGFLKRSELDHDVKGEHHVKCTLAIDHLSQTSPNISLLPKSNLTMDYHSLSCIGILVGLQIISSLPPQISWSYNKKLTFEMRLRPSTHKPARRFNRRSSTSLHRNLQFCHPQTEGVCFGLRSANTRSKWSQSILYLRSGCSRNGHWFLVYFNFVDVFIRSESWQAFPRVYPGVKYLWRCPASTECCGQVEARYFYWTSLRALSHFYPDVFTRGSSAVS